MLNLAMAPKMVEEGPAVNIFLGFKLSWVTPGLEFAVAQMRNVWRPLQGVEDPRPGMTL